MESGRRNGVPGVGGDPCVPNEKSPKIDLCSLVEGLPVRPLAIRCGVCAGQLPFDTPRVREHPAPSGALRHECLTLLGIMNTSQGAPSTIRCIEAPLRVRASAWVCRRLPGTMGAEGTGARGGGCCACVTGPDRALVGGMVVRRLCGGLAVGVCGALLSWVSEAGHCGGSGFVTRMWCWWECSLVRGVALVGVGWAARGGSCWRCAWRGCRGVRAVVARVLGGR